VAEVGEFMQPYEKLIQRWSAEGLAIVPGVSEDAVLAFESKHGVAIPADFREYLLHVDGMSQVGGHDCDEQGFGFWPLSRIKTVPDECAANNVQVPTLESVEHYFAFADYMQWSWAYAISFEGRHGGKILQFGTLSPRIIADSFAEFVEAYVHDSEQLYLPQKRA
jgi:hypothetical protein